MLDSHQELFGNRAELGLTEVFRQIGSKIGAFASMLRRPESDLHHAVRQGNLGGAGGLIERRLSIASRDDRDIGTFNRWRWAVFTVVLPGIQRKNVAHAGSETTLLCANLPLMAA